MSRGTVKPTNKPALGGRYFLPPLAISKHLRLVSFKLELDWRSFRLLAQISRGEHGISNIRNIRVNLVKDYAGVCVTTMDVDDQVRFMAALRDGDQAGAVNMITHGERIRFSSKGQVAIINQPLPRAGSFSGHSSPFLLGMGRRCHRVYDLLAASISFGDS